MGSGGVQEDEMLRLKAELAERDKRLAEQAANLADMEASVKELSALLPPDGVPQDGRRPSYLDEEGDQTTTQLRQLLREKNEKITILTSEFDAHRADFRSTLDSLEMASTETERVYEEQKRDLIAQVQELTERIQEMEEMNGSRKEFEDVANQLKGLEDFVQELEEGLEDARRGEAEARGEVEFLRGEVERGRSELKREREKASAVVNGRTGSKDLEEKDNEIRGLKAIIHSFSTNSESTPAIATTEELTKLQAALRESQADKDRLETELEQLRRDTAGTNGHGHDGLSQPSNHTRNESERTAVPSRSKPDLSSKPTFAEHARNKGLTAGDDKSSNAKTAGEAVHCEMCESSDHDTLDCKTFQSTSSSNDGGLPLPALSSRLKKRLGGGGADKENQEAVSEDVEVGGKVEAQKKKVVEEDKWCALCEKDGHLAYECPDEQY
jgi:myosin heavy subunit